ncbi:MAG: SIS domain-containing protein [Anaerolineae bacterium]|nr:SIS domain-containing protein [Anaerolineae bacterium]
MNSSYLQQEIEEQPQVAQRLLTEEHPAIAEVVEAIQERGPRFIVFAARGSSDNAARYGQYLFGTANKLCVALATPSLFSRYRQPPQVEDALVLGISQSGRSPDIVAVLEEGRRQGALTVAVTNHPDSPISAAADYTLRLGAGAEKSIAATKTYTASLLVMAMLSTVLAKDTGRWQTLQTLPNLMAQVVAQAPAIIKAAERYRYMEAGVVISRGYNYGTAFEIALKLKELTYVMVEPYSTADFQHGPLALVEQGFPVIAVVPEGEIAHEMLGFLRQLREREAELVVISAMAEALALAQTPLPIPAGVPEWMSPLVAVVPGQIFAWGLTLAKGFDPDHPRGLRKVTLTR